jgi:two-component sensor histidine kinase
LGVLASLPRDRGEPYEIEYRLRHHSGTYRWTLGRALPILDAQGSIERWFGTCTDIHDLKEAETARDLISRELSHRIQNIFAAVHGLTSIAARKHPEANNFAQDLITRIHALSRAHRYVNTDQDLESPTHGDSDKTDIGLISTVLAPYQEARRVTIQGADAPLAPSLATPLALILHELATNSLKYGSLSGADGELVISVVPSPSSTLISWTEKGGPRLHKEPEASGFGSLLVSSMMAALGGVIARSWSEDGLSVEISLPG